MLLPPSGFARAFPALATPFTHFASQRTGPELRCGAPTGIPESNSGKKALRWWMDFASKGDRLPCSRLSGIWIVWSWRRDLNPRPSDYKSDALPAELRQPKTACTLPHSGHTEASQNSRGTRQDFSMGSGEVQWRQSAFTCGVKLGCRGGEQQVLRLRSLRELRSG
jgi:hypothetical protein